MYLANMTKMPHATFRMSWHCFSGGQTALAPSGSVQLPAPWAAPRLMAVSALGTRKVMQDTKEETGWK